ncbi:hypothetical protein GCM10007874_40710 [Labrys miyagiensis]|uniref:Uncharacterized protein n=1 Tax=Labrys miyagiensis TaxID=346912 RepID=A0ABQ6CLJ2_9HYPH|nr:hypothetical protein GCM10007874_40710 [Labrys miyagiensis]
MIMGLYREEITGQTLENFAYEICLRVGGKVLRQAFDRPGLGPARQALDQHIAIGK